MVYEVSTVLGMFKGILVFLVFKMFCKLLLFMILKNVEGESIFCMLCFGEVMS